MLYTIIDIETTGNGIKGNKITEIAIFKFDGTRVVGEFTSLVNPECEIPYFITGLTGIDDDMVRNAPLFKDIADKILEMTKDCIFVAHAVNFDYGVIKEEFRQIGVDFTRKKLCTVRLSRKLVPGLHSYSLGKICSSMNIPIVDRHRAHGDAKATVTLFKLLLQRPSADQHIIAFLNARSQEATLPPLLSKEMVNDLPQLPGVYYFKNKSGTIIYVGKAINIKKRVLGHFYDKSTKEIRMCREIASIDHELSGNELLALLMESAAIKKHFPLYNSAQKRFAKSYAIFSYEDRNGLLHLAYNTLKNVHDPIQVYYNQTDCRTFLKQLCEAFSLCPKYCHLQTGNGLCTDCSDSCTKAETIETYNQKVNRAIETALQNKASYFIKEKGRTSQEDVLIAVKEGIYLGYAFIEKEAAINSIEDLEAHIVKQKNTLETESIISGYLIRKGLSNVQVLPNSPMPIQC
ncbi:exonuclease domain-containing protein [Allomuricauda sp. SCSIO 65647]|uniref:exonuclease domain-containing protein n=1 Tax=Allomuricauda sp. SCSIO 65647 TaxID=2908843 RepID=UPI001F2C929D|nr:exonuclease domain-containing protein [Muricauda sp. SCSIO 65647]UJH66661.1 GIY-YIG nuclease family protein [Muricauda sp. SCSIO 65647]